MTAKNCTLTQKKLKEILHYNSDTGVFTWIKRIANTIQKGDKAGTTTKEGYIRIMIDGVSYYAHRLSFLYINGSFPKNHIDHVNHIGTDNRWTNIRYATCQENNRNRSISNCNASGVMGVHFFKKQGNWQTYIYVNSKKIHLGYFGDYFDAVCARKSAEKKYSFHENHGAVRLP